MFAGKPKQRLRVSELVVRSRIEGGVREKGNL